MLSATQKDAYRQRLLGLMSRLEQARDVLKDDALRPEGGETSGGLSNVPLHPADLGSHVAEEAVALGLVENKQQMIAEINDALKRLDQGVFGCCEACRQPIASDRLQALPYARYCVACARKFEGRPPL